MDDRTSVVQTLWYWRARVYAHTPPQFVQVVLRMTAPMTHTAIHRNDAQSTHIYTGSRIILILYTNIEFRATCCADALYASLNMNFKFCTKNVHKQHDSNRKYFNASRTSKVRMM